MEFVSHKEFAREKLHGKRLMITNRGEPFPQGHLYCGEPRPEDGKYILTFQQSAISSSGIKNAPITSPPDRGQILMPQEKLGQDTVDRIKIPTDQVFASVCDFVIT